MKASTITMIMFILWIAIATVGRLIPHLPNATPLASLAILSAVILRKHWAVLLTLTSLCLSDFILGHMTHAATWGNWTLFTYTGYIALALCVPSQHNLRAVLPYTLFATFGYWVWTNFGTWLVAGDYPQNWAGLSSCYLAGLPFLRNAVLGNFVYLFILQQFPL